MAEPTPARSREEPNPMSSKNVTEAMREKALSDAVKAKNRATKIALQAEYAMSEMEGDEPPDPDWPAIAFSLTCEVDALAKSVAALTPTTPPAPAGAEGLAWAVIDTHGTVTLLRFTEADAHDELDGLDERHPEDAPHRIEPLVTRPTPTKEPTP